MSAGMRSSSVSEQYLVGHRLCPKKVSTELSCPHGFILLAAEYIEVGGVGLVCEVAGDDRCLDELGHGEPCNPLVRAEVDDLWFAESLHIDQIAEFDDEPADPLRVPYRCRIAALQVHTRIQPPASTVPELRNDLCVI